jgi:Ca-activated chloride channel family protein
MMSGVSTRLRLCALTLLALLLPTAAMAQSSSASTPPGQTNAPAQLPKVETSTKNGNSQFTIQQQVNEVDLVFTVTDKHGHFINNLRESDFALLDNQLAPRRVFSFTQQTDLPLRLGVLIDTSTSIRQRFHFEQKASISFLLQTLRPQTDRAFVMGFDVTPDYKQNWTNNLDLLTQGIDALHPGGGTALYDSLYSACRDKMLDFARGQIAVRRAIVLISDGDDNQSRAYLSDAIKECQRASTIVYTVSTDTSPSRDRGDSILKKIAEATGGRAFYPRSLEDMPASFAAIQNELRSQYALVYEPADFKDDGSFRSIYLYCLNRHYKVRAMKGYFAPKGQQAQ